MTVTHLEQRMANLALAQTARVNKARIKKSLGEMEQTDACLRVADQLTGDPSPLGVLTVGELLTSIRGFGPGKAKVYARLADRTPLSRRVRDLTEPRRLELARVLRERADGLV